MLMTSRRLWRGILERQMRDRFLAPYSIPTQNISAEELICHASRIYRLEHQIEHHDKPDEITIPLREDQVSFFGVLMKEPSIDDLGPSEPHFQYLPGGRWIVSCQIARSRVHLLCWDRLACPQNDIVISPSATFECPNPCSSIWTSLLSMQPDRLGESVIIVIPYFDPSDPDDKLSITPSTENAFNSFSLVSDV